MVEIIAMGQKESKTEDRILLPRGKNQAYRIQAQTPVCLSVFLTLSVFSLFIPEHDHLRKYSVEQDSILDFLGNLRELKSALSQR